MHKAAPDLPLHFHTHNTSSAALTTVINAANAGCEIVGLLPALAAHRRGLVWGREGARAISPLVELCWRNNMACCPPPWRMAWNADLAISSLADLTSQPSLNAFLASMQVRLLLHPLVHSILLSTRNANLHLHTPKRGRRVGRPLSPHPTLPHGAIFSLCARTASFSAMPAGDPARYGHQLPDA